MKDAIIGYLLISFMFMGIGYSTWYFALGDIFN